MTQARRPARGWRQKAKDKQDIAIAGCWKAGIEGGAETDEQRADNEQQEGGAKRRAEKGQREKPMRFGGASERTISAKTFSRRHAVHARRQVARQAMRFVFSITGAAPRGRCAGTLSAALRRTGITGLVPRAGKSGASTSLFTGRSGKEMPSDRAEPLRRTRRGGRCIAVWWRLWARIHSARRAWMSTSMSSSNSSIMFLRRFARSFSRASSKDSSDTFEQVARYSSIGLVVFIWIVSKCLNQKVPDARAGDVKHTVHSKKVNIEYGSRR